MNDDFAADLLTLTDDEGKELEFEILDIIENDDGRYYALLPTFETEDDDDGAYYILKEEEFDGELQLAEVEDEALLDALAEQFEERFAEIYPEDDEEDRENEEE